MLAVAALLVAAGCSGGAEESNGDNSGEVVGDEETTLVEESTTTLPAFQPAVTWHYSSSRAQGDRTEVMLEVGKFSVDGSVPALPSGDIERPACVFDAQRDVIAAGRLTLTNANEGFDQTVNATLFAVDPRLRSYESDGPYVMAAAYFSSGALCVGMTRPTGFAGQEPLSLSSGHVLKPSDSISLDLYLIIPGVRSPAFPNGDRAIVDSLFLLPTPNTKVSNVTGPLGNVKAEFAFGQPLLRLSAALQD